MNILMCADEYPHRNKEYAQALARAGHQVTVFHLAVGPARVTDHSDGSFREILVCRPGTGAAPLDRMIRNNAGRRVLAGFVKEAGKPEIVHVTGEGMKSLGMWCHSRYGVPCVLTGQHPFRTLPVLVNTAFYTLSSQYDRRRIQGTAKLVCVGPFTPPMNKILLLECLRDLRDQGLDYRLDMVGDGPERPLIEKNIRVRKLEGSVTLKGWVSPDKLRDIYRDADLFVLPGRADDGGQALLNAMACGMPAVAVLPSLPERIIETGINGYTVEPDRQTLAAAIDKAACRSWDAKRIRRIVEEKWSEAKVIGQVEELYRSVLAAVL